MLVVRVEAYDIKGNATIVCKNCSLSLRTTDRPIGLVVIAYNGMTTVSDHMSIELHKCGRHAYWLCEFCKDQKVTPIANVKDGEKCEACMSPMHRVA